MNKHGPVYYAKVDKVIGPYVTIVKDKVLLGLSIVWDALIPVRQWANKTLPPIWDDVRIKKCKLVVFVYLFVYFLAD